MISEKVRTVCGLPPQPSKTCPRRKTSSTSPICSKSVSFCVIWNGMFISGSLAKRCQSCGLHPFEPITQWYSAPSYSVWPWQSWRKSAWLVKFARNGIGLPVSVSPTTSVVPSFTTSWFEKKTGLPRSWRPNWSMNVKFTQRPAPLPSPSGSCPICQMSPRQPCAPERRAPLLLTPSICRDERTGSVAIENA